MCTDGKAMPDWAHSQMMGLRREVTELHEKLAFAHMENHQLREENAALKGVELDGFGDAPLTEGGGNDLTA